MANILKIMTARLLAPRQIHRGIEKSHLYDRVHFVSSESQFQLPQESFLISPSMQSAQHLHHANQNYC